MIKLNNKEIALIFLIKTFATFFYFSNQMFDKLERLQKKTDNKILFNLIFQKKNFNYLQKKISGLTIYITFMLLKLLIII